MENRGKKRKERINRERRRERGEIRGRGRERERRTESQSLMPIIGKTSRFFYKVETRRSNMEDEIMVLLEEGGESRQKLHPGWGGDHRWMEVFVLLQTFCYFPLFSTIYF